MDGLFIIRQWVIGGLTREEIEFTKIPLRFIFGKISLLYYKQLITLNIKLLLIILF